MVDPEEPDPFALDEAARVLRQGGLVAFATETVYGLGAVATDERAVAQIYAAKGRPAINPLIVHVARVEQARGCVTDWPAAAETLAARFWPGPLTLVLGRSGRNPRHRHRRPPDRRGAMPRGKGGPRPDRSLRPAARRPQRQPLQPLVADPGRACPGRPGWTDRSHHRQRSNRRRPRVHGARPDDRASPTPPPRTRSRRSRSSSPHFRADLSPCPRPGNPPIGRRARGRCLSIIRRSPRHSGSTRPKELAQTPAEISRSGDPHLRRPGHPSRTLLTTREVRLETRGWRPGDSMTCCMNSTTCGPMRSSPSCRPTGPNGWPCGDQLLPATSAADRRARPVIGPGRYRHFACGTFCHGSVEGRATRDTGILPVGRRTRAGSPVPRIHSNIRRCGSNSGYSGSGGGGSGSPRCR